MVKESPPHPTPSSKEVSTTPYPLFSRNLHDTLSPLPKESPLHPTPLPKESPLHLTPSSQGVYATPYPLFPRILHHTLPPLPKESTAYPTPSFVAKFPAAPARNYSTISFVCLKPALLKFSLVCIYIFFIFFCAPCRFKVWMSWLSTSSELLNYACEFTQQSNKLHLNPID